MLDWKTIWKGLWLEKFLSHIFAWILLCDFLLLTGLVLYDFIHILHINQKTTCYANLYGNFLSPIMGRLFIERSFNVSVIKAESHLLNLIASFSFQIKCAGVQSQKMNMSKP